MTMLLMGVLFLAAGWLMQRLGLTVAAIFVWLLYPSFVMWWAYRYSPACFPAVPVCLPEVSACPLRCFVSVRCNLRVFCVSCAGCVGVYLRHGASHNVPPSSLTDERWVLEQHAHPHGIVFQIVCVAPRLQLRVYNSNSCMDSM